MNRYDVIVSFEEKKRKPIEMKNLSRNQYGIKMRDVWSKYDLKTRKIEKRGEDWAIEFEASKKAA